MLTSLDNVYRVSGLFNVNNQAQMRPPREALRVCPFPLA